MIPKVILASTSPRRAVLLRQIGLPFVVEASGVDEDGVNFSFVQDFAVRKAMEVARRKTQGLVIGADTAVFCGNRVLGKPQDKQEAQEMLHLLSGKSHTVSSGVAVVDAQSKKCSCGVEETTVWIKPLTEQEIVSYVQTGEPMDKAGAYAIQERGGLFVEKIEGCYYNVVGLPLAKLVLLLKDFGLFVYDWWNTK